MELPLSSPVLFGFLILGAILLLLLPPLGRRFSLTTGEYLLTVWVAWLLLVAIPLSAAGGHWSLWREHIQCCSGVEWIPCPLGGFSQKTLFLFPFLWLGGLFLLGLYNGFREVRGTIQWHQAIRRLPLRSVGPYKVRVLPDPHPFLGITGLLRPTYLVSKGALAQLTEAELEAAIQHEKGHLQKGHLWKEQALRLLLLPFPRSLSLWILRGFVVLRELEADAQVRDHLSLASALLKVGQKRVPTPVLSLWGSRNLTGLRLELLLGVIPRPRRWPFLGVLWKGTLLFLMVLLLRAPKFAEAQKIPEVCLSPTVQTVSFDPLCGSSCCVPPKGF